MPGSLMYKLRSRAYGLGGFVIQAGRFFPRPRPRPLPRPVLVNPPTERDGLGACAFRLAIGTGA